MSDEPIQSAQAELRRHHAGELQFDEHLRPVKIVIGPGGRIIGPVMIAMLEAADTVLFLPHADEDALQLQVTLEQFGEEGPNGALTDRWRIYHGEPEDVNWGIFHIDAARFAGAIIDGEALTVANPLAEIEPRICREVNRSRRDALAGLCRRRVNLSLDSPTLVGIDPLGLDVRGPFDVVRVEFDRKADTPAEAESMLSSMLDDST